MITQFSGFLNTCMQYIVEKHFFLDNANESTRQILPDYVSLFCVGDGEDVIPNSVTNMGEDPYSVTEEMTDQEVMQHIKICKHSL